MSDIGFYGLVAALVGLGMLVIAAIGLVLELFARSRRPGTGSVRLPLVYGLAGLLMLYAAETGSTEIKAIADNVSIPIAIAGLAIWMFIRRRPRPGDS